MISRSTKTLKRPNHDQTRLRVILPDGVCSRGATRTRPVNHVAK